MSTMAIFKGRVTVAKGLASMTGGQGRNKAHRNIGNGGPALRTAVRSARPTYGRLEKRRGRSPRDKEPIQLVDEREGLQGRCKRKCHATDIYR